LIGNPTGSHWDRSIPVTQQDFLAHLLLIHNLWGEGMEKINGAYWSIAVEWQIYFLTPLFLWICRRVQPVPGVCLIVMTAYILLHFFVDTFWARLYLEYYAVFAMGVLGAAVAFGESRFLARLRTLNWCAIGGAVTLLAVALCLSWGYHIVFDWQGHAPQLDALVGMAVMALLIGCAVSAKSKVRAALSWRPLVSVGSFSYSLYLVHEPIQQAVWQYGVHPLHLPKLCEYLALLAFGSPIIVGAAYLFYLLCERPFMNTTRLPAKAAQ
jgi:peptidoglycan/LPS O-acetylase OafA/YrhL